MRITSSLVGLLSMPVGMGIGTLVVPCPTDKCCPGNRLPAVVASSIVGAALIGAFLLLDPRIGRRSVLASLAILCALMVVLGVIGRSKPSHAN